MRHNGSERERSFPDCIPGYSMFTVVVPVFEVWRIIVGNQQIVTFGKILDAFSCTFTK